MDLAVVGRHAMLFDDDGMAAFVNSPEALVDWNSLSIDRYDVRHLLSGPIPPRPKRRPLHPPSSIEADLDHQRYLDLPSSPPHEQPQDDDSGAVDSAGYRAVAFSYENSNVSTETKGNDTESGFRPNFPVPESLLHNLPPNEKLHQIISRTAIFVSKHGSQSEIILRVKQGDNPTFGFLMPDHHLHPYFRFLVDHQELLNVEKVDVDSALDKNRSQGPDQTGGALSLLGSVYGYGEDEDCTTENTSDLDRNTRVGVVDSTYASTRIERTESSSDPAKDESISKNQIPFKEKVPVIKRNQSIGNVKIVTSGKVKTGDILDSGSNAANKSQTSVPSTAKIELPVVEPPSDIRVVIERIVEFILKNGRPFEAVLAEQDRAHGRFPFLLPSNQYHTYYLKVLQTAEESKLPGKGYQKYNPAGRARDNNTAAYEENDNKFKMIIGNLKDGQEPTPKDSQSQTTVNIHAAAAAAILQAATRGIKRPNLEIFSKTSSGNGQGLGSDGRNLSISGSLPSSQWQGFVPHFNLNAEASASVPVAKAIAEKVAIAAAGEADSSEAHMSKEQKLKAERLKRAKMFAAMIKSGAGALKSELPRAFSVEPPGSGLSGSDAEIGNLVSKEREGSSVPFNADNSDKSHKSEEKLSDNNSDRSHKSEEKLAVDNNIERRSKRKYRSRSSRHEEEEEEEVEEENKEDIRDQKRSRKKHRSHRSSHRSRDRDSDRDRDKIRRKHNRRDSDRDRDRIRSKHDSSSDEEHQHLRRHSNYDSSSDEKHGSPRRYRGESGLSDREHRHSRRHYSSSEDEHRHRHRSRKTKHKSRRSHAERDAELEEGEIVKSDKSQVSELGRVSREASAELYKSTKAPSQSPEVTNVSDELRAKIRAMLMENL
ncbi:unnamed protein product [Lathyrus sativus]|nr:unnamed protein product [Lathyrus sativus]